MSAGDSSSSVCSVHCQGVWGPALVMKTSVMAQRVSPESWYKERVLLHLSLACLYLSVLVCRVVGRLINPKPTFPYLTSKLAATTYPFIVLLDSAAFKVFYFSYKWTLHRVSFSTDAIFSFRSFAQRAEMERSFTPSLCLLASEKLCPLITWCYSCYQPLQQVVAGSAYLWSECQCTCDVKRLSSKTCFCVFYSCELLRSGEFERVWIKSPSNCLFIRKFSNSDLWETLQQLIINLSH